MPARSVSDRDVEFVRAVATARTPQRTMSSRTAKPRTRLANLVCRIFKSWKIREITGIEVTATALASTNKVDVLTPLTPTSGSMGMTEARPSPNTRKNGNGVPTPRIHAVSRRFSLESSRRTWLPEMNMSRRMPSQ